METANDREPLSQRALRYAALLAERRDRAFAEGKWSVGMKELTLMAGVLLAARTAFRVESIQHAFKIR